MGPSAEEVDMQVRHGFASVGTVVDDNPEAVFQTELPGQGRSHKEQMSQKFLICRLRCSETCEAAAGNHQHMHGGLGVDVPNRDTMRVLMLKLRRYRSFDDFLEYGFLAHAVQRARMAAQRQASSAGH